MKILIITQWFDPEPTFKGLLFAKELIKEGHDVEVITGFPNYPGGKVYDGYKIKAWDTSKISGVSISRVALYPSHNNSAAKRVLNYVSFFATSCFFGLFKAKKADVIYSYHPPLTTCLSSLIIGRIRKIPVVLDIQDLWPDTLNATGMINNRKILNLVSKICDVTYKFATKIVVLSPGFKKRLTSRNVPEEKISVIYNWCDESSLIPNGICKHKLPNNGFNVVFAGNLGKAQGINSIVEAARLLHERKCDANIVFVGDGISLEEAKKSVVKNKLNNVYFIPRVPMNEVADLLSASDALLVHLNSNELFEITIPSRTQAYMCIGKPIIMGVKGDAADLLLESDGGMVCQPDNPSDLARVIAKMCELSSEELNIMGKNSERFYQKKLSVEIGVKKFIEVFKKAVNND
jgi:colanic acid biosynthesis glycosyl transferase WcaI